MSKPFRIAPALAVAALLLLLAALPALANGTITVCPEGPPTCDYTTIQDGVDAADAGDTVLVGPGVYTEQVTLKSDVALSSTHGALSTTVTYSYGPIISATNALSVHLQGIGLSGQAEMSPAIGVQLLESGIVISECIIADLQGSDGFEIDAVGIDADGGALLVIETLIRDLQGGAGEEEGEGRASCDYYGGDAVGIRADGVEVTIEGSELRDIQGGQGCYVNTWFKGYRAAGDAVGMWANSGTIVLSDNLFADLSTHFTFDSPGAGAVRTSHTTRTVVTRNVMRGVNQSALLQALTSPQAAPPPPPGNPFGVAVQSQHDAAVLIIDNVIEHVMGRRVRAIDVHDSHSVTLSGNQIAALSGGGWLYGTEGIRISQAAAVTITANAIRSLVALDAGDPCFENCTGAYAAGIHLGSITRTAITNNRIWHLEAGAGGRHGYELECGSGGPAYGLWIEEGQFTIQNNTIWHTAGGRPRRIANCTTTVGTSAGILAQQGTQVLAINNAIVSTTIGITTANGIAPILAYNAFWETEADYGGATIPGANDLHVAPAFANPPGGDFRLLPFSSLIDAGTNLLLLAKDFEGEPRPFDGDDDGVARVDIGADEYHPWLLNRYILPVVMRRGS